MFAAVPITASVAVDTLVVLQVKCMCIQVRSDRKVMMFGIVRCDLACSATRS